MTYIVPQVLIRQKLTPLSTILNTRLQPFICGGNADIYRFDDSTKEKGRLGNFKASTINEFLWPNKPAGAVVDQDYTKIFIENALLRYYSSDDDTEGVFEIPKNSLNEIVTTNRNLASNGIDYPHDNELFFDQGVQVGDYVKVTAVIGSTEVKWKSRIIRLKAEYTAATINPADADDGNTAASTSQSPTITRLSQTNDIDIETVDDTNFDALIYGKPTATYTIRVIQAGAPSSAILSYASDDGLDTGYLTGITLDTPISVGSRGLKVTFSAFSGAGNFTAEQGWTISLTEEYTIPTVTSGGTYSYTKPVIYIVKVIKGGIWTNKPIIQITNNRGTEFNSNVTVTKDEAIQVGHYGVTITFSGGTGLVTGDIWYITVTPAMPTYYRTIVLENSHPSEVITAAKQANIPVAINLYKLDNVEIPKFDEVHNRANWSVNDVKITINPDINVLTSKVTVSGAPASLSVDEDNGQTLSVVYAQVRYWLSDLAGDIYTIYNTDDLSAIPGPMHPDNPLKYAASKALTNSTSIGIHLSAVKNPSDINSWAEVLDILDGNAVGYDVVPLTQDTSIINMFLSAINLQSVPERGMWRRLWFSPKASTLEMKTPDDAMATIEDDPELIGNQYSIVVFTQEIGLLNNVVPGDKFRINFRQDSTGEEIYDEYEIQDVLSQERLRLKTPLSAPITIPMRAEIWHENSPTDRAKIIAKKYGISSRRAIAVWPDNVKDGSWVVPGYNLAAAVAALACSAQFGIGITNVEVNGFSDYTNSDVLFSRTNLDYMAENGVFIVGRDIASGKLFVRHALTTGDYSDVNEREENITRNLDLISYNLRDMLRPYIGRVLINQNTISDLNLLISKYLTDMVNTGYIQSYTISRLEQHPVIKDQIIAEIKLTMSYPLNVLDVTLIV